jgi:hypothetical protein
MRASAVASFSDVHTEVHDFLMPRLVAPILALTTALSLLTLESLSAQSRASNWRAHARDGQLLCLVPTDAGNRCNTVVRFQFLDESSILVIAETTMAADPHIVMSASYLAKMANDALCGNPGPQEVQRATFRIGGVPASQSDTDAIRAQLVGNLESRDANLGCMMFEETDGTWTLRGMMNGVRRPDLDAPIKWLPADAVYEVTP